MLNFSSALKKEHKYNDLTIKEIAPVMKLIVRGKKREFFTNIGKNLNMILPTEANTSSTNDKISAIWLSPDEWLIFTNNEVDENNNKYELEKNLFNSVSKLNLGAVINVTDQFVMLELEGKNIYELFSTGSPFDFSKFKIKQGSTTQTLLNHIDVIIRHKSENLVNLFVRRSFSEHLSSWINDSASRL